MRLLPAGDRAVLVDLAGPDGHAAGGPGGPGDGPAWFLALAAGRPAGVEDVVPAESSVLVRYDPAVLAPAALVGWLHAVAGRMASAGPVPSGPAASGPATGTAVASAVASAVGSSAGSAPAVEIPVVYAGPDLDEVGRITGLGPDGVVAAHTGTPWQVAFIGFAPGFGYLVGGDPRLQVPRRDVSRVRVPAGSVGLGGRYSGVYPRESPGGWQLLGSTPAAMWDPDRDPPALLRPGALVRFVAVRVR